MISVIIPTYNQARFVGDAIRSALAQDIEDIEVVVADDCSIDGTADIVRGFSDRRLRYEPSSRNLGRVANYRRGLYELARGEWVINLDGDDMLVDRSFLRAAMAAAGEDEKVAIVFADRYEREDPIDASSFPSGGAILAKPEKLDGTDYVLSLPRREMRMHHLSALYRRSPAMAIGFYRADIVSSDYESLYRLAIGSKIVHLPTKVAVWRRHMANASTKQDPDGVIRNFALFTGVREHAALALAPKAQPAFDEWLTRNIANRYYVSLMSYLRNSALGRFASIDRYVRASFPSARLRALCWPKTYIKGAAALAAAMKHSMLSKAGAAK
jgi:glycosyltransferase involved in cell wall biosynthesis